MIPIIRTEKIESICEAVSKDWEIPISLKYDIKRNLPITTNPELGIVSFPQRINYLLIIYYLCYKGKTYCKPLVGLIDKINTALFVGDMAAFEVLKNEYCKKIKEVETRLDVSDIDYCLDITIRFYLYHEFTHIRVFQQPYFFEERKNHLKKMIEEAHPLIRKRMIRYLKKDQDLGEEVICDLEACKRIKEECMHNDEFKKSLLDIVHTLNIMNSVNNIRKELNKSHPIWWSLCKLSNSDFTINNIARFCFIQNFWIDDIVLTPKEIMNDILLTARAFGLDRATMDFCRQEYKKSREKFIKSNKQHKEELLNDICKIEEEFVSIITTP